MKLFSSTGVTLEPVSYTHLDVYKRQILYNINNVAVDTVTVMELLLSAFYPFLT